MDGIICSGVRTKVLLLSATPVNNTLTDLRNQISMIAGGDVVHDSRIERYYKESVARLGGFPKRTRPESIYPDLDNQNLFMSYDRLNSEISRYTLSLFNPSRFVKDEFKADYEKRVGNFT